MEMVGIQMSCEQLLIIKIDFFFVGRGKYQLSLNFENRIRLNILC